MKQSIDLQQSRPLYLAPCCLVVKTEARFIMCQSYRTGGSLPNAEEEDWGTL